MNTHETEFVTHIPPLWPCIPVNRFLKVYLLIGIFNMVQGQNLTGENTQRHPGVDEITRLYWDDLSIGFSNGFISFFRFFYSLDWPRSVCVSVSIANCQLSRLTSAIDSHQSADRSRSTNKDVGMKEAYFLTTSPSSPLPPGSTFFKDFVLIQAIPCSLGSRRAPGRVVLENTRDTRGQMKLLQYLLDYFLCGKAEGCAWGGTVDNRSRHLRVTSALSVLISAPLLKPENKFRVGFTAGTAAWE